jgi:hypothetical protein
MVLNHRIERLSLACYSTDLDVSIDDIAAPSVIKNMPNS